MRRDMDLIREILLKVEGNNNPFGMEAVEIEGRTPQDVGYQMKLLVEAGLVEAGDRTYCGADAMYWHSARLTWEGHEFLDAARDDTRWNKMKAMVKEKAGTVGFEVVKQVLVVLARQAMGL